MSANVVPAASADKELFARVGSPPLAATFATRYVVLLRQSYVPCSEMALGVGDDQCRTEPGGKRACHRDGYRFTSRVPNGRGHTVALTGA